MKTATEKRRAHNHDGGPRKRAFMDCQEFTFIAAAYPSALEFLLRLLTAGAHGCQLRSVHLRRAHTGARV